MGPQIVVTDTMQGDDVRALQFRVHDLAQFKNKNKSKTAKTKG